MSTSGPTPTPSLLRRAAAALLDGGVRLVRHLLKWLGLGSVVGVLAGLSSAGFLVTLEWATATREEFPWLLWFLPLAGLAMGLVYHYGGGDAVAGNNLILDEIHEPRDWIPRRMAPLIYVGTVVTQLFGGSAGREGTALQMSGSLTDAFSRVARLAPADRRIMLIAALSGGFGAVFGVPVAGFVFGVEVHTVGRLRFDALLAALTASMVGDLVVTGLGVTHTVTPEVVPADLGAGVVARVVVAGVVFGVVARVFIVATHQVRRLYDRLRAWPPIRPAVGGVAIIGLTYLVGNQDYNGLSLPLISASLAGGAGVVAFAFVWKLVFTSVTLGSGFQGGEVTPLFVIGATLGVTLAGVLGLDPTLVAALGFVAVFAGAANVPITCTIMGAELFGADALVLFALVCVVSYLCSSDRGIYTARRIAAVTSSPGSGAPPGGGAAS